MVLRIGVVELQELGDLAQRKAKPLATQNQLHPRDLAACVDAGGAHPSGLNEIRILVETQRPSGHA